MKIRLSSAAVLAILACAAPALAQNGPDVIVGDLYQVSNYGGSNGRHAYAVGTISCNLGNEPLTWEDHNGPGGNVHPVISQNLYRLHNGRFEQIGQAWLKHGFCALQGNVCQTCTPGGSCDALFPGCSDPYSSSLNGTQSGLGPKSEVNAATGAFPYPWNNNGTSTDAVLFKRLHAADTDLALPGALYFVSSSYIQPEDAARGNDNNNQSYRRVTFSAAPNYAMSLADTTQRTKPALQAWQDNDPSVTITNVDVENDGRYVVASKVTDNGNGTWRYEYAVQNLNSDRSGQSFSIPLPEGATVTNAAFKDIDYHSGEPYSGTDWTINIQSSHIQWSTQFHMDNPNANALRWDTIYNFRFDCDQAPSAPAAGAATLALFKPGIPTVATANVTVPAGGTPPPPTPPANDACANATAVGSGSTSFFTTHATTDGPAESCGTLGNDVWFRYTAPCSGTATFATCGSGFDSAVGVYNACPGAPGAIACNDDSCGQQSSVTLSVTSGGEYLIRVGSNTGAMGAGTLTISGPSCAPAGPANDLCANAITLTDGVPMSGTTVGSTNDGTSNCGSSTTSPDVWYAYTPDVSATVTITTCGTAAYDTVLAAYSACGGSQLACNDDTTGCTGLTSTITVPMTGGQRYLIRVTGYNNATGTFTVKASGGGLPPVPFNDACANRAGIGTGATTFDTRGSFTDGPSHACGLIENDVWFNLPAQQTGTATFSTCGATFDTFIAVYDNGGCDNFEARLLSCNDDAACPGGNGLQSSISIPVTAGRNYTVRVGGRSGASGTGTLNVAIATAPPPAAEVVLMTFGGSTAVPGVGTVADEDVVAYNPGSNTWSMVFDGSDVGLSALTIDGLAQLSTGELLLSFTDAATIPGMTGGPSGTTLDDSDIVKFTPTSLGATTSGTFQFFFDASDVGLTTNNEDVDAIEIASNGQVIVSCSGSFTANASGNVSGAGEDLIIFTPTATGANTAGTFALYVDGSDVALSGNAENLDAMAVRPAGGMVLSTTGNFAVTGVSGADEDLLRFTPTSTGGATAGSFAMEHDLTTRGIAGSAALTGAEYSTTALITTPAPLMGGGNPAEEATVYCSADFNGDEDVGTDADIEAFFACLGGHCCKECGDADFNHDGDIGTDQDIEAFFRVLGGGAC
ncbi:MAG TPA: hypothetical protein VD997_15550 [Phycisphaerales bacterium]|nr:hypothetical protein [Phycisphaerales bacterium]